MNKFFKNFKVWYTLARPNKKYWFLCYLFVVLSQVCVLIAPTFAARTTVCVTSGDYMGALIYLVVVFLILFLQKTFWHIDWLFYGKLVKSVYNRINLELMDKVLIAKNANYENVSKEQLLNIINTDVNAVADFADKLATALGRLTMMLVTVVVVFTINVYAGIIVFVADILDFLIMNWFNTRRQAWVKKIRNSTDEQYQKFSEIIEKKETIIDLSLENEKKKDYEKTLNGYVKNLQGRTIWDSAKSNYYEVFYSFLILVGTLICLLMVSQNVMVPVTYFLVVTYITNGIKDMKDVLSVITNYKDACVSSVRVNAVLNFVEKEKIKFGSFSLPEIMGSICFEKVEYKRDEDKNPTLKNFDVLIREKETCLIYGPRNCGKRTVFNMLRRSITPLSGQILIDGVNILEYNKDSYRETTSYVTTSPVFFKGSIIKNLTMIEKNRKIVYEICREVGVYEYIQSLPKKFKTDISTLPYEKQYLLSLARSILTNSDILLLYEFPQKLEESDRENIKELLNKMHGTRTIIIFSAQDYCIEIVDKIVEIEKGKIKNILYNMR